MDAAMRMAEPCYARLTAGEWSTLHIAASMTALPSGAALQADLGPTYIKTNTEVRHGYYRRVLVQGRALSNQRHTDCYARVLVPAVSIFGSR